MPYDQRNTQIYDRLVQAMRKGDIKGLVLQDPINMGYQGVKTIVAHFRGWTVNKRIDSGSVVATLENIDEPKIRNLLEPDFKKWLNE
jgi:ribose transport system substrate-binding protein